MDLQGLNSVCTLDSGPFAALFIVLGMMFHLLIRPFEVDYQMLRFLSLAICLWGICSGLWSEYCASGLLSAAGRISLTGLYFNAGLALSMTVYRGFLHRLHGYPGPFLARFSKIYAFSLQCKNLQYFSEQIDLRQKYGDFVRTGPREMTIFHPSAVPLIYGSQSPCQKSAWYHQVSRIDNETSVNTTRDPILHRLRRRAWDRGLGLKALTTYIPMVELKSQMLVSQLRARLHQSLDVAKWTMFYSFDVMGLVGFDEDFHQLESAQEHYAIKGMHDQMFMIGLLTQIPWLSYPLNALQPLSGGFGLFKMYCDSMVKKSALKYQNMCDKTPRDIISWLLKAQSENDRTAPPTEKALAEDGNVLILAGSDTTGNTLACALHYLVANPGVYKTLQRQLDEIFPNGDSSYDYAKVQKMPYLDAILKETMRLKPAVPGGQPRVTPPEGLQVGNKWIPGDINVLVPQYALQRDDRFFPEASKFLPERWLDRKESLIVDEQAYFPFQIGSRGCVGKEFAMMSMRMFVSRLAMNFDLSFAPGEDGVEFDTQARDYLAIDVGPLFLMVSERTHTSS